MKQPELSHSDGTSPCLSLFPMRWLPLASTGHVVFSLTSWIFGDLTWSHAAGTYALLAPSVAAGSGDLGEEVNSDWTKRRSETAVGGGAP